MTPTTRGRRKKGSQGLDEMPLDFCEVCRRTTSTTRNSVCAGCAVRIAGDRRRFWPRSEGNGFMRQFGRAFRNYFKTEAVDGR